MKKDELQLLKIKNFSSNFFSTKTCSDSKIFYNLIKNIKIETKYNEEKTFHKLDRNDQKNICIIINKKTKIGINS